MSGSQIFLFVVGNLVVIGICAWLAFRTGYNVGWNERHKAMTLPRNIVKRTNDRIDWEQRNDRHSGVDNRKVF